MTDLTAISKVSAPLPWQAESWTRLNQQIGAGQLPHALLIAGPQYTGKSRLAMALARRLLCSSPADGLNCGTCHPCELSASGNHGDFRWLEPEGKSRILKIDQIRKVVEFSNTTAGFGLRKIVVISPAESMNNSAANALLKVLEEPAANTYLLLVCHRPHGLPPTVRSRCQISRPGLPSLEQSLLWLDRISGTRQQSERLLDLAGGQPLLAEKLYGDADAERLQIVRAAMRGIFTGQSGVAPLAAVLSSDTLEQGLAQLVDGIQSLLRTLDGEKLVSVQARGGFRLLDEIAQIQRAVNAGSNPNQPLLVDTLLGKVQLMLGDGGLGDNIE